jgi:hypothetical protein
MTSLAELLQRFGYGPQDPGPDETFDTRNVLDTMQKRAPNLLNKLAGAIPENTEHSVSLANMLKGGLDTAGRWVGGNPELGRDTLAPLGAGMMGAAAARYAAPNTGEPILSSLARYGKAMSMHQRNEARRGNEAGYPAGLGILGLSTAGAAGAAAAGWPELTPLLAAHMYLTRPNSVYMKPHTRDVRNMYNYLRDMELRDSPIRPDNTGTTLY